MGIDVSPRWHFTSLDSASISTLAQRGDSLMDFEWMESKDIYVCVCVCIRILVILFTRGVISLFFLRNDSSIFDFVCQFAIFMLFLLLLLLLLLGKYFWWYLIEYNTNEGKKGYFFKRVGITIFRKFHGNFTVVSETTIVNRGLF